MALRLQHHGLLAVRNAFEHILRALVGDHSVSIGGNAQLRLNHILRRIRSILVVIGRHAVFLRSSHLFSYRQLRLLVGVSLQLEIYLVELRALDVVVIYFLSAFGDSLVGHSAVGTHL